jgi:tetratricopeptide (TPR) repeat protein
MKLRLKSSITIMVLAAVLTAAQATASPNDLLTTGRIDDAIASVQAQLKNSPQDASLYHTLTRAYFALQDWDHAISNGEKSVALAADNSDYHLWLGRAYGEKADRANPFSAASLAGKLRREFERAVQLNPSNVDARTDLAEFYLDAPGIVGGGQDKARAQADALATLSPQKAHYLRGRLAEKSKDIPTAEKEYRAAIEASGGNANDWLNLALLYKHVNRFDDMEKALTHATTAKIAQNEILVEAGEILMRTGRSLPAAADLVRRYIESGPPTEKSPLFKAHYVLGTILEKEGDQDGAAKEYRTSLQLASRFAPAQQALNRLTKKQGS